MMYGNPVSTASDCVSIVAYMFAKIMQMRGKKACFLFPECSLSYAKIMKVRHTASTG